jgi:hypothetical protein
MTVSLRYLPTCAAGLPDLYARLPAACLHLDTDRRTLLTTVLVTATFSLMVAATIFGLAVHRLLRRRQADNRAWAEAIAHRLTAMGNLFQTHNATRVRGTIAGRTAVLAQSADRRTVAVVTLNVPLENAEGPRRPNLRLPEDPADHRFGPRWVQVWTRDRSPSAVPPLLARALSLAQAAETQQTAPWALFAGQRGLAFRASREGEPCMIEGEFGGVPVHVHLDGVEAPPVRTVIVAAFPRRQRRDAKHGSASMAALGIDLPDLLERYEDAEVEDGTVRVEIDGMVVDDLEERLREAILLARAFASSASS